MIRKRRTSHEKRTKGFSHLHSIRLMWSTAFDLGLRPGSNTVLHISRTQFNQWESCEVRRLTQLSSTDFIWTGWGVLHAWPAVNKAWRLTLGQTAIFTWVEPKACIIKAILTLLWKTNEQDRFCYLFGVEDQFDWIKFEVWLKQACVNYLIRPKLSLGSAHVKYGVWPGPKVPKTWLTSVTQNTNRQK